MKKHTNALIFGIAIIAAAVFLGNSYANRNNHAGEIQVTGLGSQDFTSDLIVWGARFEAQQYNLKDSYTQLEKQKAIILNYLTKKGVPADQLVFSAVQTSQRTKTNYSTTGQYIGEEFIGYQLYQSVEIESKEVEKIEKISREVTELLNEGVQLYSNSPRYYYTKLSDLKIEMISKATEDARVRAENIAKNSGSLLGKLKSANMGIFQITGQNSNEDYSWGGTFNTSSKEKTASITMKLEYKIK